MLLGALLDAGAGLPLVHRAIASLGIGGLDVTVRYERRGGLRCARARVSVPATPDHERHLAEVLGLVDVADLDKRSRATARRVFELLAAAEGHVHGVDASDVHFHEVAAYDSLADVVGVVAAAADLGLLDDGAEIRCSPLGVGSGTVRGDHGELPVPAPAVLRLVQLGGLVITGGALQGERTTPTGAALLATLATGGPLPAMRVRAVGTGGGTRDTVDRPNITRVVVGTGVGAPGAPDADLLVVEATVDDLDPQLWPSVLEAVRHAGAWDCWTTPMVARQGRPGQVLTALCAGASRDAVVQAVFRHTTTLGVRWSPWQRATAPRTTITVGVGPADRRVQVGVKVADLGDGLRTVKPEMADVEAAARALGWPVRAVQEAALARYRETVRGADGGADASDAVVSPVTADAL
ncbi:MAG: nickel pincer cofactor biosynthesis protein LarC [Streptosporangiaceae bacterium]